MRGRQAAWSDPTVQKLASNFIPVADEVWRLKNRDDPECLYFKKFCEEGHYGGRSGTRQGIYCATPSGRFLASINTVNPRQMAGMLREALEAWEKIPRTERLIPAAEIASEGSIQRGETRYPEDGLVLKVYSRDLARRDLPDDWRSDAWNLDFAWFLKEEAASIYPTRVNAGAVHEWPEALVARIARFHLLDNVRGQTNPYDKTEVVEAWIRTEIVSVRRGVARMKFVGETRTSSSGAWPLDEAGHLADPGASHGVGTKILGNATYDSRREEWTVFELVAAGVRWGETRYNFRGDDLDPAPIGFALMLAGDDPADRVAPAFFYAYGW